MYTDSPYRVKFANAEVMDTVKRVGAELMLISIIKIWCRNPLCPNHYQMIALY